MLFNYVGIREHGIKNYLIKFMGPSFYTWHVGGKHIHVRPLFFLFFPLETILDAVRMVTLAIRLLANMFADHTVVGVFLLIVPDRRPRDLHGPRHARVRSCRPSCSRCSR